jgi:hypothetical protein
MTVATAQLSESLQSLIDARLDTIDRMLLGRVGRQERLDIVREVEAQVFELLQERDLGELSRDDVLTVLARLDPPEAYIPDESAEEPVPARNRSRARIVEPVRKGDLKIARLSGILGLVAMTLILFLPLDYWLAVAFGSAAVLFILGGGMLCLGLIGSILAIVFASYSRMASAWAVVGVVTGAVSLLLSFTLPILVFLLAGT